MKIFCKWGVVMEFFRLFVRLKSFACDTFMFVAYWIEHYMRSTQDSNTSRKYYFIIKMKHGSVIDIEIIVKWLYGIKRYYHEISDTISFYVYKLRYNGNNNFEIFIKMSCFLLIVNETSNVLLLHLVYLRIHVYWIRLHCTSFYVHFMRY